MQKRVTPKWASPWKTVTIVNKGQQSSFLGVGGWEPKTPNNRGCRKYHMYKLVGIRVTFSQLQTNLMKTVILGRV